MSPLGRSEQGAKLGTPLKVLSLALSLVFLLAAAPPSTPNKTITVGDLAVVIAGRLGRSEAPKTPLTAEEAAVLLQKAGIQVREDLTSPATEGDAIGIFRQFGISVGSQDPSQLLDRDRANSLVGVFGTTLAAKVSAASSGARSVRTDSQSTASQAAVFPPESIADCQALPKTQDCQTCCRSFLGGDQSDFHTNRICGKACNTKARNVSAAEPTP